MSKVALVTGGNRGIGLACARALQKNGHRVAITYNSSPPPSAAHGKSNSPESDSELYSVKCNIADSKEIEQAFSEIEENLGIPEILISNAGITADGLSLKMSDENFTKVLEINLTGGFKVARRALKNMVRAKTGRIIFISSVIGLGGAKGQANYAASKAGIFGLARSLAKEFASRSITVNVIAPGPIETDMTQSLTDLQKQAILEQVPLGRFGTPEEVGELVNFLASDSAGYITGAIIPLDGGVAMGA